MKKENLIVMSLRPVDFKLAEKGGDIVLIGCFENKHFKHGKYMSSTFEWREIKPVKYRDYIATDSATDRNVSYVLQ